jgi:hypothetical protein
MSKINHHQWLYLHISYLPNCINSILMLSDSISLFLYTYNYTLTSIPYFYILITMALFLYPYHYILISIPLQLYSYFYTPIFCTHIPRPAICTPFWGTVPHFDLLYPTKICTPGVRTLVPHLSFSPVNYLWIISW